MEWISTKEVSPTVMTLTGKCKIDFNEWYKKKQYDRLILGWIELPPSMQWGVYVDFFDSRRILISTSALTLSETYIFDIGINRNVEYWGDNFKTMNEARTAAIEKANEIYNYPI